MAAEPCLRSAPIRGRSEKTLFGGPDGEEVVGMQVGVRLRGMMLLQSEQLLAKQQTGFGQNETSEQAQTNGGYGVISLFDGVSSVVPTLTRKFGYAPVVAILAENDIDVRAVVCAEFGYRADEQWSFTPQGTAALYVKDVHSLIAKNCQVLRSIIEAYPGLKWIVPVVECWTQ